MLILGVSSPIYIKSPGLPGEKWLSLIELFKLSVDSYYLFHHELF